MFLAVDSYINDHAGSEYDDADLGCKKIKEIR